ncbi:hypothetical protein [Rheinheimera nanhaiensis]|uniref:Transmembrane cytochrome oxidase associated protein n=1 Tax=Rheinheimera nanhaiensis E407-8 TaxID=562729 RepID=I1DZN2_9GAMM|nr:hypothetical protein [Rheinheimera nanhaiensis]GAB59510.1 hypothetical protein RNAN_2516 [Rheinheimera nanhaiensis E407-8]
MNKYKFMALFIGCCALPLLAAWLVLTQGWFNAGASSQGQWQQQEVFLLAPATGKAHWRLAVAPAASCDSQCQQGLHTLQQLYLGLGRKQQHVQPLLLGDATVPEAYQAISKAAVLLPLPQQLQNQILLIDQQGLVLLRYPLPATAEQMAPTAKAIRQDLLKLVNYDRTSV